MTGSVLRRRLYRQLRQQRWQTLAVAAVIAIGTLLGIGLRSAHRDLAAARDRFYARQRIAGFWIRLKRAPRRQAIAQASRCARWVEGRIVREARMMKDTADRDPTTVLAVSLPAGRRPRVNDVRLIAGRYFEVGTRPEGIVGRAFAHAHGIRPGSHLRLLLGGRVVSIRVIGIALSPEFVYLLAPGSIVPDPARYGVVFLPEEFMEQATGLRGAVTELVGRLRGNSRPERRAALRMLERSLSPYGVLDAHDLEEHASHRYLSDEIRGLAVFGVVIPTLFLIVALLVLQVILWRQVDQDRPVIGVLKALGYPDLHVAGYYAAHALSIGLLGVAAGLAGGALLHRAMIAVYRQFFELPGLEARFHPADYAIVLALGIGTAATAAARAVWVAWREPPAAAMRPAPATTPGLSRLLPRRWPLLARIAGSYLVRRPLRSLAGIAAVALATSMLLVGLLSYDSTIAVLDHHYRHVERHDWSAWLRDYRDVQAVREIAHRVRAPLAEGVGTVPATIQHGRYRMDGAVLLLPESPRLFVPWESDSSSRGIVPHGSSGVALSRWLAKKLAVRAGDRVTLRIRVADRRVVRVRVLRLVDDYLGLFVYAPMTLARKLVGHPRLVNRLLLLSPQGDVAQRLAGYPSVVTVRNRRVERAILWRMVTKLTVTYVALLVGFAAVLLFSSLLNVVLVSLMERRRDYATLLALGFCNRELGGMLAGELAVLVLTGTAAALPLGITLTHALIRLYNTDYFRMPLVVHPHTLVAVVIAAAVFGTAVWVVAVWQVARGRWQDWLRSRE